MDFNVWLYVFKQIQGMRPYCFSDLTRFHHTHRPVRSAYYLILTIPQPCFNFKAKSVLSIAALRLWISPPLSVMSSSTINMFKTNFNTYVLPLGFEHVCSPFVLCVILCRTVQNWLFSNVVLYKYIWLDLKSLYFSVCRCIESQLRGQVCNANTDKQRISLTALFSPEWCFMCFTSFGLFLQHTLAALFVSFCIF